jgi:glutathione S-transferase
MSHDLTLWGAGSSRTMRAHWMLLELGLAYEFQPLLSRSEATLSDEFRQLNPRGKIPVLRDGSFVLTESAAILQYLADTFGDPAVFHLPADPAERARINEWNYFIMSELDAGSLYVIRRHSGLKHVYGEAPAAVASAQAYFLHNLEAMVPQMDNGRSYLFGERLSVADLLLVTCLDWALSLGIFLPEICHQYRGRVVSRPAYQAARQRNFPAA